MRVGFRKVEEKYDILRALRHDGLLKEEYIPDVSVEHTAGNLWREMLRFKACISRLDDAFFCLYFPPEQERGYSRTGWFGNVLKEGVPQGIRMTTIDLKRTGVSDWVSLGKWFAYARSSIWRRLCITGWHGRIAVTT